MNLNEQRPSDSFAGIGRSLDNLVSDELSYEQEIERINLLDRQRALLACVEHGRAGPGIAAAIEMYREDCLTFVSSLSKDGQARDIA